MEEVEIYDMDAEPSLIARFFENDLLMYRSVLSRDEAVHFAQKILGITDNMNVSEQGKLWEDQLKRIFDELKGAKKND